MPLRMNIPLGASVREPKKSPLTPATVARLERRRCMLLTVSRALTPLLARMGLTS
jgi:hypothetical protein